MLIVENEVYICSENSELTDEVRKLYFGNPIVSPLSALASALKNINLSEIVALVFVKGVIYLAAKGQTTISIVRNNLTTILLRSSGENVVTASGYPKDGDVMILKIINNQNKILTLEYTVHESSRPEQRSIFSKKPKFLNIKFPFKLPERKIYIKPGFTDEVSPQSKKTTFLVALILLGLLGVSIGFGIRQKKINDLKNTYLGILSQASDEVDQAISLASVSSDRSRQLFMDAEQKIKTVDALKINDSKLVNLKQKINESRASILREYVTTPQMYLDLTLLSSGFKGDTVAFSGGQIYVMDSVGKRIVSVNASTKKSKVVAGPNVINSAIGMACYEDRVFVLATDGIYEIDGNNATKVITKTWSGDALIAAFAGNMYVVDKLGNQILRYQGQGTTFSDKQNWLASGTNVNFTSVRQITIDGLIYALYPNSKILKFSQGSPLNFNISGVIPEIGNIDAINANPDNQNVYVLDRAGKRVVVLDKKGAYKAQYVNETVGNAINLVVSEKDSKIILLTGDKLYSIDIKHL